MAEVFSESLDYTKVKARAVQSRSYRVKLPPINAGTYAPSSVIEFELPSNLAGTYFNSNQCYLKFKMTSLCRNAGNTAAVKCDLDRSGAYSFIRRMEITTGGAKICDLDRFNVLACAMIDTDASQEWKTSTGSAIAGTEGLMRGAAIDPGDLERIYCLPLILNPIAMTSPHRLIPLFSLSPIKMRFTLEEAGVVFRVDAINDIVNYQISDVELVYQATELSPAAQANINENTGGKYDILATSYMHSSATLQATNSQLTASLGFSVSSLERVIICHRRTSSTLSQQRYSLGNRCAAGLQQYNLLIDTEMFPARPIMRDHRFGSECVAEMLLASHSLVDFTKGSSLNDGYVKCSVPGAQFLGTSRSANIKPNSGTIIQNPYSLENPDGLTAGNLNVEVNAATTDAEDSDVGTFLCAIELESGVSDGKSSHIYSGVSTLGSSVQYVATYSGDVNADITVDFFCHYSVMMSLNMQGSGIWSISI